MICLHTHTHTHEMIPETKAIKLLITPKCFYAPLKAILLLILPFVGKYCPFNIMFSRIVRDGII